MRRDFAKGVRALWRTFGTMFDPYRPELHYMRGPGPKCRAKRLGAAKAASAAAAAPGLGETAKIHV